VVKLNCSSCNSWY